MNKRAFIVYLTGIALVLSSLFYIAYVATKAVTFAPADTVIILPVRHDSAFLFERRAVEDWANSYEGLVLKERVTTRVMEAREGIMGFAQTSFVNSAYFSAIHVPIVHGSLPQSGNDSVVVLCQNMAFALFGATHVVNESVQMGDSVYTVIGVANAFTESAPGTDGFAWILESGFGTVGALSDTGLCGAVGGMGSVGNDGVGVLYLSPEHYIPLSARMEAETFLRDMGFFPQDFTITDVNAYSNSIILRAQLLIILCLPIFILFTVQWISSLYRFAKSRGAYIVAAIFSLLTLAVAGFFVWVVSDIELWIPAYAGEGIAGFLQVYFNTGLLAPRVYLPPNLAKLLDLSNRANIIFLVGVFGITIIAIVRLVAHKNTNTKAMQRDCAL